MPVVLISITQRGALEVIVGGRVIEASAKKNDESTLEGMNVNINIQSVETKDEKLLLKYDYSAKYLPDKGEITVVGELLIEEEMKKRKEVEDFWKKKRELPPEFAEEILTAITYTCSAVGTLLAFAVGLTAPINVGRARITPVAERRPKAS